MVAHTADQTQTNQYERMRIRFTNTDSTGQAVTRELSIMFEGDRYEIPVEQDGTANVSESVGEHLVNSDRYAVERDEEYDETGSDDLEDEDYSEDRFEELADELDEDAEDTEDAEDVEDSAYENETSEVEE